MIVANSDLIIMIGLVIAVFILGMVVIPYLQRKKYITIEGVQISQELFKILKLLLIEADFKNKSTGEQASIILDTVEEILDYIEDNLQINDVEKKKDIAYNMVLDILEKLDIEINENRKMLIQMIIENAIDLKDSSLLK